MIYQPGLRRLRREVASGVERVNGERGQLLGGTSSRTLPLAAASAIKWAIRSSN